MTTTQIILLFLVIGTIAIALGYIYLSIYFNTKSYFKKVSKYKKLQLIKLRRSKKRGR